MLVLAALLPTGCAMRGDVEMLESELRRQEQTQQELSEQLQTTRDELRIARADAGKLRTQLASRGEKSLVSEQAETLYKTESLKFSPMLTTGFDNDGRPGDEGISVLLMPVDSQGDLVKLAGAFELELVDLNRSGNDQRVGHWHFSDEESRTHWHRGFLSAGYLFRLDWQNLPASPELTLHARLTAPDGRRFDATTQIKVNPPATAAAPAVLEAEGKKNRPQSKVTPAAITGDEVLEPPPDHPPQPKARLRRRKASKPPAPPAEPSSIETSDKWTDDTIPYLR
jgi:outer membrane murein-binding lipoprotein Lpp